jgi:formylglycine-generating enzyme required for sulfatase activity
MSLVTPFDWVTIPAGAFLRGSDTSKDKQAYDNETSQRRIYLSEYQIARVPVTNTQYKVFVDATGHRKPEHWIGREIPKGKTDHPVVYVTWQDAMAFCTWAGVRLPTEAEWEKAARGPSDTRKYPWGDAAPDNTLLNYNENVGDTTAVGSYPAGASPYGVLDMAGNVWEWVNDWHREYYGVSLGSNPQGPATGQNRVLRGGSWDVSGINVRCANRVSLHPGNWNSNIGFRCVRSP